MESGFAFFLSFISSMESNIQVPYSSRRSTIYGTQYMVSSTQPLATQAGIQILEKGGNAADAAVAVAAALNVTEPFSTGIGGDCFCLFYNAKDKTVQGLNGSGRAPEALTLERATKELGLTGKEIPARSVHSATVPGAAAGWVDTVGRFGSGNVALPGILEPAIALAEEGFPVSELTAPFWKTNAKILRETSPGGQELLINGEAPLPGQIFSNPGLAQTLRLLAKHGKRGFYEGPVADALIDILQQKGSLMTHTDLQNHLSTFDTPISYDYRGHRLYECAPNGCGLAALVALGIIDQLEQTGAIPPIDTMVHNSAEYIHMVIEALRLAFADARHFICDPAFKEVPIHELLSPSYLQQRAQLFDPSRAAADVKHGCPMASSDTVYFSVIDKGGNACSFTNSLYHSFGTAIVPSGFGFAIHDRGALFQLDPNHVNCLAPGKRPYHTIIPAMVTHAKDNGLFMSFGCMGGHQQAQSQVLFMLNMLRFGMSPQAALDAPRVSIQVYEDGRVAVEEGIAADVVRRLHDMDHCVYMVSGLQRAMFGRGQIIRQTIDAGTGKRVLAGGSEPRADGQTTGR